MEFPKLTAALTRKKAGWVALGALGGYAYYFFIGCTSGTCPITSNPWISTAYGALIGAVLVSGKKTTPAPDNRQPSDPEVHS